MDLLHSNRNKSTMNGGRLRIIKDLDPGRRKRRTTILAPLEQSLAWLLNLVNHLQSALGQFSPVPPRSCLPGIRSEFSFCGFHFRSRVLTESDNRSAPPTRHQSLKMAGGHGRLLTRDLLRSLLFEARSRAHPPIVYRRSAELAAQGPSYDTVSVT